jgi:hypothetical protein
MKTRIAIEPGLSCGATSEQVDQPTNEGSFGLSEILEWAEWVARAEGTEASASGNAIAVAHAILEADQTYERKAWG